MNAGYNKEIRSVIERVKKLNNLTQTGNRLSEETNNQILALKAKLLVQLALPLQV